LQLIIMRYFYSILSILILSFSLPLAAQPVFWSDTFDPPVGGVNNNNGGVGWIMNSGVSSGNLWYINNSNTNCQGANMLHISCDGFICELLYDAPSGSVYDATVASNTTAVSPNINTTGQSGMTLRFFWTADGDFNNDYGVLSLSADGGTTWTDHPNFFQGLPQGTCQEAVIPLASNYENITNFKMRFRWINNGDNVGLDYPLCVDDIKITANPGTSPTITTGAVSAGPYCPGDDISIPFTVSEPFDAGNVFTAQFSNAAGAFTAPVVMGTLNGTTSGTINATIPMGTAPGTTYQVRVIGSTPSVIGSSSLINVIVSNGPTSTISNTSSTTVCTGSSATLLYSGTAGTVQWLVSADGVNFAPIPGATNNTLISPPLTQTGYFQVTVTTSCGTATSPTWTVTLANNVDIPLTYSPNSLNLCNGPITVTTIGTFSNLVWSDGQTNTPAIIVTVPGNISVTGQDPTGCPAQSQTLAFIETTPPALTTNPVSPVTICGNSATITASAGFATYLWSNGQSGSTVSINTPGSISVTGTDNNGCVVTSAPIQITTGSSVSIPVEPSIAAICDGEPATITAATGFNNYVWSNGATGEEITVSSTGFYSVTADDANGCPGSSALVEVIQSQFPIANFSYTQTPGGYTINFNNTSQNSIEYVWDFDSIGTSPLLNPSFTFPDSGPYYVNLIIENPCGKDTITKLVIVSLVGIEDVNSNNGIVVFPNPAQDYINLTSELDLNGRVLIKIFDLSGRLIKLETIFINEKLNHKVNLSALQEGSYLIEIEHNNTKSTKRFVKVY
jgi:hypothetical protein